MGTSIHISNEDGVTIIGASNGDSDYCLWQVSNDDKNSIYFEHEDQINGGYNIIVECSVMADGIHIVLANSQLYHFYFNDVSSEQYNSFVDALKVIYPDSILEVIT